MDLQDYKDISRIYNEKTFKKQLFFQGIFLSFIVISIPIFGLIMETFQINAYLFTMQISLAFILWISISSLLEKKEIFIPWKNYRLIRYRVSYLIVFYIVAIRFSRSENPFFTILIYTLIYIPIEIYSGYKEFVMFKMKMDKVRH